MRSSSARGIVTSATCFVVTEPSAEAADSGTFTTLTRALTSLRRCSSRRGSRLRIGIFFPSGQQLYVYDRADRNLALSAGDESVRPRADHRREDVRTLRLRGGDMPAVVP